MKTRFTLVLGVLILGLLLVFASGVKAAPGDPPFALGGVLSVTGSDYSIQGQPFIVDGTTVCTDLTTATVLCTDLNGRLVKVAGYISTLDTKYHATSIQAQPATQKFSYTGEIKSTTSTAWTIDSFAFQVGTGTVIPPFYAVKDTVVTTYTVDTAGNFLSEVFQVLNSGEGVTYTYSGTVTTISGNLWTVGEHTFDMSSVTLPPYYNLNDKVEVTFKIVNGDYVATAVKVTETVVGTKVESNRCENRMKKQPAVYKLAKELKEDPEKLTTYFCSGFGIGEIKLAYKLADKGYTPAMLLAMRASGMSWGEIKQKVASTPVMTPDTGSDSTITSPSSGSTVSNAGHGNSANAGKSNNGNGSGKNKPNHSKKP